MKQGVATNRLLDMAGAATNSCKTNPIRFGGGRQNESYLFWLGSLKRIPAKIIPNIVKLLDKGGSTTIFVLAGVP